MKTLMIMRHAKSSWKEEGLSDHDRPLNKRGLRTAPMMAKHLLENECWPDLIISSTANRARSTAELLLDHSKNGTELITDKRLYHALPSEMAEVTNEVDDEFTSLMLVAHNPGMQQLTSQFAGAFVDFPTAAIAVIDLRIDAWKEFHPASEGDLRELWIPRSLAFD